MSERVTYARELVAAGHRPAVVARILQISRQAIYRGPKPRRAPASPARPPADEVEAAIVAEAEANPTDGYRLVTAWVRRRLGRRVNRKRVLRVMRAHVCSWPIPTFAAVAQSAVGIGGKRTSPTVYEYTA